MAEASSGQPARERPLSPHLQIYRPEINMVMSVFHRLTGVALYFGALLLAWWLFAAATNAQYFAFVNGLFATWFGMQAWSPQTQMTKTEWAASCRTTLSYFPEKD